MNRIVLMGRLTKDPEIRYSSGAEPMAIARYTLAVNRRFKREGEPDADFINITAFRRDAEFAEKWLKKGMMVAVTGRLQVSTFDNPQGQRVWYTDVIVDEQNFAESRASFEGRQQNVQQSPYDNYSQAPPSPQNPGAPPQSAPPQGQPHFEIDTTMDDDDLPF